MVDSFAKPDLFPPHMLSNNTRPAVKSGICEVQGNSLVERGVSERHVRTRFSNSGVPVLCIWMSRTCVQERAAFVQIAKEGSVSREGLRGDGMNGLCMQICSK